MFVNVFAHGEVALTNLPAQQIPRSTAASGKCGPSGEVIPIPYRSVVLLRVKRDSFYSFERQSGEVSQIFALESSGGCRLPRFVVAIVKVRVRVVAGHRSRLFDWMG